MTYPTYRVLAAVPRQGLRASGLNRVLSLTVGLGLGLLAAPALAAGFPSAASTLGATGSSAGTTGTAGNIQVGAATRTFTVHVPNRPAPQGGYPLIIAFHGGGMQGAGMERVSGLDAVADQRGFIVVYPDGIDRHWNDGRSTIRNPQDDIAFTSALIDTLVAHDHVDRTRVFATGVSNGALFVERLGCDLSGKIAGIAAVAGSLPKDIAAACRPSHPVAVLQIDGTADPIMPFEGGAVADFGGRGEGGQVLSVGATVAAWAAHNRCTAAGMPKPLPVTAPQDPTRATQSDATGCQAKGQVSAITVMGGGHAWPGGKQVAWPVLIGRVSRQFDASETIADFFLEH